MRDVEEENVCCSTYIVLYMLYVLERRDVER